MPEHGIQFLVLRAAHRMKIEPHLNDLTIWNLARSKWGATHEKGMAVEELAETITAINHMSRGRDGSTHEFVSELADAMVCSFQIVENNNLWDDFREALKESFSKMDAKLKSDDRNHRSTQ